MKNLLLLLSIFASSLCMQGQNKLKYAYDAAGNRVKREIVVNMTKSALSPESSIFTEELAERIVKIYPNPTKGQLVIEISDVENAKSASLTLYNLSGQTIARVKVQSNSTDLDISSKPDGVYILQINIDGKLSSWRIIKE